MATPYPPLISRTTKSVDWMMDYELEQADNASLAAYDRRLEIERNVTFSDLVEEMADFTDARQEVFMQAYRRGTADEKHTMYVLIDQAFERLVEKKLKGQS